jgi:hypothetical protein
MNLNEAGGTDAIQKIATTEINMKPALETAYEEAYEGLTNALDQIDPGTLRTLIQVAEDNEKNSNDQSGAKRYEAVNDTLYFLRTLQRKEGDDARMEFIHELAKKHLYTIADARSQIEADARFHEGAVAEAVHQLERVVDNLSQLRFPDERETQEATRRAEQADFIADKRERLKKIGIS